MSEIRQDPATSVLGLGPQTAAAPIPPGTAVATPIPTQQAGPQGGIPDYLQPLVTKIKSGESADRNVLYGGSPVPEGNVIPGAIGPTGQQTHAFTEWQFQPATWNAANDARKKQGLPPLNKDNPNDRDWAGLYIMRRDYKTNTGRDLDADGKAGKIDTSALGGTWTSLSGGGAHLRDQMFLGSGMAMQQMREFDRQIEQQSAADRSEYERIRRQPDPNAEERRELLNDARDRARQARDMYANLSSNPPSDKPIDALTNFGSFGTMLALLIGGMGRHHMTGALGAAGAMMQAAQANNHEQFERQYKIWDHQTNTALNLSRLEMDEIHSLMEDKRLAEADRQNQLHNFYEEHNMGFQAQQLRAGMLDRAFSAQEAAARAWQGVANQKYQFGLMMAQSEMQTHPDRDPAEIYAKWGIASPAGVKLESDPKLQAARTFQEKIQAEKGHAPTYDDWVQFSQSTKGAATGQLSPDAVKLLARQYETGDPGVITSLPRGGPGRIQVENQVAEDLRALPDGAQTIVMNRLRMGEARAAATAGGKLTMNTDFFSREAEGAGQLLITASEAFPRTELPKVNAAIAAYERNTGDPRIIKLGAAIFALENAYGKMSNPTGIGIHDADKERLRNLLDASLSTGQIRGAVEQIVAEGRNLSNMATQAQVEALANLAPKPPGSPASTTPSALPPDLPSPQGHPEGYIARDDTTGQVVAKIRNGQWVPP